ncbi:acyltransferase [Nostoc sp.]|uniref:acyltransferase n=1 Tax=Nostoc sp. TaxID=1180 RepID=UPI002FF8497D
MPENTLDSIEVLKDSKIIWLENSRIIAIFAVVFLHVAGKVVDHNSIGSEYWWIGNIYESMVRWCVPVFVMISGALLLDPNKKEGIFEFYRKRTSRILNPLIAWSIIFLIWRFFKEFLQGHKPTAIELVNHLLLGKPYFHMWFLFMIIGLYLFTPFLRKIVAQSTTSELIFFICATFAISSINTLFSIESKLFINWFLSYLPYYFLGYLITTTDISLPKQVLSILFTLSILLTSLGYFIITKNYDPTDIYFYEDLGATVILMSVSIMFLFKYLQNPILGSNLTNTISTLTLGIYLIHPAILDVVLNFVDITAMSFNTIKSIPTIIIKVITIPVTAIITFLLSLFCVWLINKIPYVKIIV